MNHKITLEPMGMIKGYHDKEPSNKVGSLGFR